MKKLFGPKMNDRVWKIKIKSSELSELYASPDIVAEIKENDLTG